MWYATLAEALAELVVNSDGGNTTEEERDYVRRALEWTTNRIDNWPSLGFEFAPRKGVRYVDAPRVHGLNSWGPSALTPEDEDRSDLKLDLGQPILEVASVVDGMGDTLVLWNGQGNTRDDSDYYLYPRNESPFWTLRMLPESDEAWSDYRTDRVEAIQITGTWGYRSRYESAWKPSGQTLAAEIDAATKTFTVADASVFSPGQLIQLGSEWTSIDTITEGGDSNPDTIAVTERGERGTTAAEHTSGTAIALFAPEPMIVRACANWVAYLYSRRGVFTAKQIEGFTTITFPPDAPPEVAAILETFAPKSQAEDTFGWGAI